MRKLFEFRILLVLCLLALGVNGVWADTSTLTFTAKCNGSGTASTTDKLAWSIASNATESTYDNTKGIHYGTNNATVQYVTLTTTNLYTKLGGKKITEVTVNCTDAGSGSTASVTVGGVAFSVKSGSTATVDGTQGDKTFTGSKIVAADETIVIDIRRASNTKKAIYVKSVTITYEEGLSDANFSFPNPSYNATYGSSFTKPALSTATGYDGTITYSSSNELVATVNSTTGDITLVGGGTARITASGTETATFKAGSAYYDLTVSDTRADHGLTYATSAVTKKIGVTGFVNPLTNPNSLSVTYESDNTDVATVNATTGAITALTAGEATITASFTGNSTYKAGSASYTLTVSDGAKWVKVTDAANLHAGDQIIIVNESAGKVLSTTQNENNRAEANITISAGVATMNNDAQIITLERDGTNFYLNVGTDEYLYAASSTSNHLKTAGKTTDSKAAISITSGDASIIFKGTYNRNDLRYNSTSNIFSCYGSTTTQDVVQIYKKISDVSVTVSSVGYATLHYGDRALTVPAGMEAYTYLVNAQNKLEESWLYGEGDVIPAGQAVVLKADAGTYNFELATTDGDADADSQLKGLDEEGTTTGTGKFYHLTLVDKDDVSKGAGFFWGNDGGTAFTIAAHKAYLVVPTAGVRGYMFNGEVDDDLTAIESAVVKSAQGPIYDLQGRRVEKMTRGIYLVDGKKVMK